jgi:CPSF A subunit region
MQVVGEYHLGEFVNKFQHGSLVMRLPDSDTSKIPTLLFCTINGVIGVIATLPAENFSFLVKLQVPRPSIRNMFAALDAFLQCTWFYHHCDYSLIGTSVHAARTAFVKS